MITEEVKELVLDPCILILLQKVVDVHVYCIYSNVRLFCNSECHLDTNGSIKVVDIIVYCRKTRLLVFIVWT